MLEKQTFGNHQAPPPPDLAQIGIHERNDAGEVNFGEIASHIGGVVLRATISLRSVAEKASEKLVDVSDRAWESGTAKAGELAGQALENSKEIAGWAWDRGGDKASEIADRTRNRYHESRVNMAIRRKHRAADRLERMEHKDALYAQAAEAYTTGSRSDTIGSVHGATITPRTVFERRKVFKLADARHELQLARDRRRHHENSFHIYGTQDPEFFDDSKPVLDIMHSNPFDISSGKARRENKKEQRVVRTRYRNGGTPEELRIGLDTVKAKRTPVESAGQRRHRQAEEKAVKRLVKTADQPVLRKWREVRRRNAIKDIQDSNENIQKHRA